MLDAFRIPAINRTIVRNIAARSTGRAAMRLASLLAPRWAVAHAADWFVTPPRHASPAREAHALDGGWRVDVGFADGTLATWRFGEAWRPVVILSHGWGGRATQWAAWIAPLRQAGFQVIVFDHLAHGHSTGRQAPITAFAAGLAAVARDAERRGSTVAGLVGHSLGCAAIGIALKGELRDLQAARVVQIAPPSSLIRYSRHFARHIGLPERLRAAMQWRLEQRIGAAWERFEMPQAVQGIRAACLFIHDDDDRDVSIDSGLTVARAWEGARFKRTFGLGHVRILRDAHTIGAAIDFLTGRVEFAHPPDANEWSRAFASLSGNAPLY
jgi:pimeloyl-ACP methyl ester carboxylesterase